jgi:hypothetical protein
MRLGIIVLTVATAAIHLYLGLTVGLPPFILNGLGYLVLLAALYAPIPQLAPYKDRVRWVLVGFTALTIVLWVAIGERTLIGYLDKLIEVALITLLLLEQRHRH